MKGLRRTIMTTESNTTSATKTTDTSLRVTVRTHSLLELEGMLERIHAAAKEGQLDWDGCEISLTATFTAGLPVQSFEPLERAIEQQNRLWGVDVDASKLDVGTNPKN
jgi:hypothetical protein